MLLNKKLLIIQTFLALLIFSLCPQLLFAQYYTGYHDSNSFGYDGVQAQIEYIEPTNVCNLVAVWTGLDNVRLNIWGQVGWGVEPDVLRTGIYSEVARADGSYNIYFINKLVDSANYKFEKKDTNGIWSYDSTVLHEELWSGIVGENSLIHSQYNVEIQDTSCDYVPGSRMKKDYFKAIKTRVKGDQYRNATLTSRSAPEIPTGNIEKNISIESSNLAVWDSRNDLVYNLNSIDLKPHGDLNSPVVFNSQVQHLNSKKFKLSYNNVLNHITEEKHSSIISATQGVFHDANPFGAEKISKAILVTSSSLKLSSNLEEDKSIEFVDVNVVMDITGKKIIAAYTNPKKTAIKRHPSFIQANPEDEVEKVHMDFKLKEETNTPNLKVQEVMNIIWNQLGTKASNAGQIILRPRWVKPHFPLSLQYGEYLPQKKPGLYWIVEIVGSDIRDLSTPAGKDKGYLTGFLAFIEDSTGELYYGIGLP